MWNENNGPGFFWKLLVTETIVKYFVLVLYIFGDGVLGNGDGGGVRIIVKNCP